MIDAKNIKVAENNESLPCIGQPVPIKVITYVDGNEVLITTFYVYENTGLTWFDVINSGVIKHCEFVFQSQEEILEEMLSSTRSNTGADFSHVTVTHPFAPDQPMNFNRIDFGNGINNFGDLIIDYLKTGETTIIFGNYDPGR